MKKLLSVLLSATLWLTMTGFIFTSSGEDALVDQVQAGVVSSYSESTQTINQPDAGYLQSYFLFRFVCQYGQLLRRIPVCTRAEQ